MIISDLKEIKNLEKDCVFDLVICCDPTMHADYPHKPLQSAVQFINEYGVVPLAFIFGEDLGTNNDGVKIENQHGNLGRLTLKKL